MGMAITWPQGVTPQYFTFNTTSTAGTLISTGNINGYSISAGPGPTDEDENRKADMEETIAELEQENEELRALLLDARMAIGKMVLGNGVSDEDLEVHLDAVRGEFE